jgi:hypothetical protein
MDGHNAPADGGAVRPAKWVTHAKFDEEIIAIDLESGAYFAMDDVAAHIWSALGDGATVDDLTEHVVAQYDVSADRARPDVDAFVNQLVRDRLAEPSDAPSAPTPAAPQLHRLVYETPVLEKFDDLEELLLLDPIHEVDEAGWPIRREA